MSTFRIEKALAFLSRWFRNIEEALASEYNKIVAPLKGYQGENLCTKRSKSDIT